MALIATMLVNLKANAEQFNRAMASASLRTSAFERQAKVVGAAAGRAFMYIGAAAAGMAAVTLRAYAQQEEAERGLRAALNATGQAAGQHMESLLESAKAIQRLTIIGDEAALALMKQATNLGINAEQLPEVTRGVIGLSEALGINMQSAIRYGALALQGEFTVLQRYVPALRMTTDAGEKLAIVQRLMASGWEQAQERTKTFWGRLVQLKNELGDVAEKIGEALVPAAETLIGWLRTLAVWIGGINASHVRWAALATGVVLAVTGLVAVMGKLVAAVKIAKIAYAAYGVVKAWVLGMTGAGIVLVAAAAVAAAAAGVAIYKLAGSWEEAAEKAKAANEEQDKIKNTLKGVASAATDAAAGIDRMTEVEKRGQTSLDSLRKAHADMYTELNHLKSGLTEQEQGWKDLVDSIKEWGTPWQIEQANKLAGSMRHLSRVLEPLRAKAEATKDALARLAEVNKELAALRGVDAGALGEKLFEALRDIVKAAGMEGVARFTTAIDNIRNAMKDLKPEQLIEIQDLLTKGVDPLILAMTVRSMAEINRELQKMTEQEEAAAAAKARFEDVQKFAEGVKESLKTPIERFKEFRDKIEEVNVALKAEAEALRIAGKEAEARAIEELMLTEAEKIAALREKMAGLMGREGRKDVGEFMEISRGIDIRGLIRGEAKPELEKLDKQIVILDDIRAEVRKGGGLVP